MAERRSNGGATAEQRRSNGGATAEQRFSCSAGFLLRPKNFNEFNGVWWRSNEIAFFGGEAEQGGVSY